MSDHYSIIRQEMGVKVRFCPFFLTFFPYNPNSLPLWDLRHPLWHPKNGGSVIPKLSTIYPNSTLTPPQRGICGRYQRKSGNSKGLRLFRKKVTKNAHFSPLGVARWPGYGMIKTHQRGNPLFTKSRFTGESLEFETSSNLTTPSTRGRGLHLSGFPSGNRRCV